MRSKARLLGHPMHQMMIVLPLGLLAMSFVFDLIHLYNGRPEMALTAYYMIVGGVITGVAAAVPGTIDYFGVIPKNTRARRIGMVHGLGNSLVLVLFILSWRLRRGDPTVVPTSALVLSAAAVALAGVTGWLGGELVDRLGIGVDPGAHADAPNSLTHEHAAEPGTSPSTTAS